MEAYCLKCRTKREIQNATQVTLKNGRPATQGTCPVCGTTRKTAELIPELYLHGLSEGDFDLALRGLLGEDAPVSASTVARLKSKWNDELAQWRSRPLDDLEVVYMWVDGVYVKAGLEKEKAAVLVVMAALSDGSKVVVSTVPGYRESTRCIE